MFALGDFTVATISGLSAVLQEWVALPGLSTDTVEVPGADGAFFAGQTVGQGRWVFDLTASAATPAGVLALANQVAAACAPGAGLQPLLLDVATGWVWYAVAAEQIKWKRGVWVPGGECVLLGTLTLAAPSGYGYAVPDETATSATSVTITRAKGNLPSFPRIEIAGVFSAVTLTIGGKPLTVTAPVASGQKLVLDYADLDFAVYNAGGVKVRHAAQGMSSFERVMLPVGEPVTVAASTSGVTSVAVKANSRRA